MKYVGTEQFYNTYKIYNLVSVTNFFSVSVNHPIFQHVKMSNCSLDPRPVIEMSKKTHCTKTISANIQLVNKITILLNL